MNAYELLFYVVGFLYPIYRIIWLRRRSGVRSLLWGLVALVTMAGAALTAWVAITNPDASVGASLGLAVTIAGATAGCIGLIANLCVWLYMRICRYYGSSVGR
jgi:preprotein translocase subunit SecD